MKLTYKLLCIFYGFIGLLTSCATLSNGPTTYNYAPVMAGGPIMYQPKPMSSDISKTANYLSAGYTNDFQSKTNGLDEIAMGTLMYMHGHTYDTFSYGYGGYVFLGSYTNKTTKSGPINGQDQVGNAYFNSKNFSGFGLQASACFFTNADNIDFRFL